MNDFFEIDFLDVESNKSGDAIPLRYRFQGQTYIHVVDGGFQDTGKTVVDHIMQYYDNPSFIDHVVVTHPDGDHSGGLKTVLEEFKVGHLWMLRPWLYAEEIIDRFSRFKSVENLERRLKDIYDNIADLEEIAEKKDTPILEPFQGKSIGEFTVLAPTKQRYLDLIVQSEKTPETSTVASTVGFMGFKSFMEATARRTVALLRAAWGQEVFSTEETSAENEMSVIQYAKLCNKKVLLTGDAGRAGLLEAFNYASHTGLSLPGIDRFQVPHHGSRRNVSTEILDQWLGKRLPEEPQPGQEKFTAFVSSAKKDEDHPRKAVVRAMIHRGAKVVTTEAGGLCTSQNAPHRDGWSAATPVKYPLDQED